MRIHQEQGEDAFIQVQPSSGWPSLIAVSGTVKCLLCSELANYSPVCDGCQKAIAATKLSLGLASSDGLQGSRIVGNLEKLVVMLAEPGLLSMLAAVVEDLYAQLMLEKIVELD